MLLIGLTGSIATGKSTVSKLLSGVPHNLTIIDADVLAREVVAPGTGGYRAIVAYFEPTTPDLLVPPDPGAGMAEAGPDGKGRPLNRAALGRRVFGDDAERRRDRAVLNGIVHPAVRRALYAAVLWSYLRGERAVVLDVPLLFESGLDLLCGLVLVVGVRDPAVQMARLRARDPHLSAEDAQARVQSQVDVRDKARRAEARGPGRGYVVWNDGSKEELESQVTRFMAQVSRESPGWWSTLLWGCPPLAVAVATWQMWTNWRGSKSWIAQEAAKAKL
jgi:dephospho-CoA kinase